MDLVVDANILFASLIKDGPPPIVLSIRPQYAEAIFSGKKTVEFRKASFPKRVCNMVLYATAPVKRIVGIVKVKAVVVLSPEGAWRRYRKRGAIDKEAFDAYYAGAKKAVCLEIGKVRRLAEPVDPKTVIRGFQAPQSFRYLDIESLPIRLRTR
jgi:predicted transcriptional regulator